MICPICKNTIEEKEDVKKSAQTLSLLGAQARQRLMKDKTWFRDMCERNKKASLVAKQNRDAKKLSPSETVLKEDC